MNVTKSRGDYGDALLKYVDQTVTRKHRFKSGRCEIETGIKVAQEHLARVQKLNVSRYFKKIIIRVVNIKNKYLIFFIVMKFFN